MRALGSRHHAVLLLLNAIWGASYVAVKDALATFSPGALVATRFWLAAATLLPWALRRGAMRELRAAAGLGSVAGVLLSLGFVLQGFGMRETAASTGGFVSGLIPLLVAVGGCVLLRARVGGVGAAGLILGLVGLACLVWPAPAAPGQVADSSRGVLLQVGAAAAFAGHVLLLSRVGRDVPALAFCLWQLVFTALVATLLPGGAEPQGAATSRCPSVDVVFLGVLATGLAVPVQVRAQPLVPPVHVALLFATQPLFAALAGALVLAEALRPLQLLGGAGIIAGIVVTALAPADGDRRVKASGAGGSG